MHLTKRVIFVTCAFCAVSLCVLLDKAFSQGLTRAYSRACRSSASTSISFSFFARSTSEGKIAGFSRKASSPYIWRQLMVPLVQLTAWWPSCAPHKVFEAQRAYPNHVQPLHVVVAQAALAAANWMPHFHRVQTSPEAQLAHIAQ